VAATPPSWQRKQEARDENSISGVGGCRPRWKRDGGTGKRGMMSSMARRRMGYHPCARLSTTEIPFLAIYHEDAGSGGRGLISNDPGFLGGE